MAENVKKESIFLTAEEAVRAICIDFKQYPPQTLLFAEIISQISKNALHLKREPGSDGAWINRTGRRNMQWLDGSKLTEFMCQAIASTHWDQRLLTAVCSRVFQTHAFPAADSDSGDAGIRIQTNMEAFSCRQCGHCCRSLDYHHEVTDTDISCWKALGRNDILKWVEVICREKDNPAYRVWVSPKTRQIIKICPFLEKIPTSNRWRCRIHDIKPGICRQYPISRKHALMTGCVGFHEDPKL
jgi:Fe-S-cluster containining protein